MNASRVGWGVAAILIVGFLLLMTLVPDETPNFANLVPLREHSEALGCLLTGCDTAADAARFLFKDVAGNVVVFIPVGFVFAGLMGEMPLRRRFWTALAMGAALSLFIEAIQIAIPTRATDVDDLLFNALGAAIGAGLFVWSRRARPSPLWAGDRH
ncbi:VanZ family protein [bacterium]|nr:VanZ family protein [bacterium]